jgi:DNA repair and recombination protein RAD54B
MKRVSSVPKGKQIVDVVLDPFLGRHLRPHQQEGVKFMYECVMGMKEAGEGAILADEMGLGKTLQTIALLWTLLKQNPIFEAQPVIKKAMIVCPVTLINNWRKEFKKWLGLDRIGVFVVDNDKKIRLSDFTMGKSYSVMIIGYEKLRLVQDELKKGAQIDIVIADEGHRLKTAQNKSAAAIKDLGTEKRIILSGTPLQNDLSEFFTMVDFVNPALLGKYSTFKREFETPILQSRVPNATQRNIEKGTARSEELARLTSQFILRRTAEVIAKFLPPKTETVLFIRPTTAQAALYNAVLESPMYGAVLKAPDATLALINYLKKLCNSPTLLTKRTTDETSTNKNVAALLDSIPPERVNAGRGAKMQALEDLLLRVKQTTDDKVVLVSNYTSTLDILGNLLAANGLQFLRLDGSTPAAKRQGLVDRFNNSSAKNFFAFLLSAKAGGVGLNLIGASRLVLFDVDWNPATDLQAMARIHRDGQKKPCYIYRFLIKGAIDEKIFQRQVTKTGLADSIVDSKKTGQQFTHEELRDLFRLDEGEACQSSEYLTGAGFVDVSAVEDDETFEDEPLKAQLQEGGSKMIPSVFSKTTS